MPLSEREVQEVAGWLVEATVAALTRHTPITTWSSPKAQGRCEAIDILDEDTNFDASV